jgi:hypothetical protein
MQPSYTRSLIFLIQSVKIADDENCFFSHLFLFNKKVTKNEIKFFCFFLEWELLKGIDILLTADDLKKNKMMKKKMKTQQKIKKALSVSPPISLLSSGEGEGK